MFSSSLTVRFSALVQIQLQMPLIATYAKYAQVNPMSLPMLNEDVVKSAIKAGLATNCNIAPVSYFARKHYFYPDLPKNYQITQSDIPICTNGYVSITARR